MVSSRHTQSALLFPACMFLVSSCVMALEIALSRLLSVLYSYHYVFLVLSLALLGLGIGGMISWSLRKNIPADEKIPAGLGWPALLFAVAVPAAILLVIQAGRIAGSAWAIVLISPMLCTPFAAAGLFMAEMYRSFPGISHQHYGELSPGDIFFHQQRAVFFDNAGTFFIKGLFIMNERTVINPQAIARFGGFNKHWVFKTLFDLLHIA